MRRSLYSVLLLAGVAWMLGVSSTDTYAGRKKEKTVVHKCTYCAHGSAAERAQPREARGGKKGPPAGRGGGGGGKKPACAKTFGKWSVTTIDVYINASHPAPNISENTFTDYVHNAFDEWSCHSGLGESVTFNFVGSPVGAEITVSWGNLGSTGVLGRASTNFSGSSISHSAITMNNNAALGWTAGPGPSVDGDDCAVEAANAATNLFDFLSVMTHEVGHSLGVAHPNNRCSARDKCYPETMYSCTDSGEYMRRALNDGDKAAIASNYGDDS